MSDRPNKISASDYVTHYFKKNVDNIRTIFMSTTLFTQHYGKGRSQEEKIEIMGRYIISRGKEPRTPGEWNKWLKKLVQTTGKQMEANQAGRHSEKKNSPAPQEKKEQEKKVGIPRKEKTQEPTMATMDGNEVAPAAQPCRHERYVVSNTEIRDSKTRQSLNCRGVRNTYKKISLELHPDQNQGSKCEEQANKKFIKFQAILEKCNSEKENKSAMVTSSAERRLQKVFQNDRKEQLRRDLMTVVMNEKAILDYLKSLDRGLAELYTRALNQIRLKQFKDEIDWQKLCCDEKGTPSFSKMLRYLELSDIVSQLEKNISEGKNVEDQVSITGVMDRYMTQLCRDKGYGRNACRQVQIDGRKHAFIDNVLAMQKKEIKLQETRMNIEWWNGSPILRQLVRSGVMSSAVGAVVAGYGYYAPQLIKELTEIIENKPIMGSAMDTAQELAAATAAAATTVATGSNKLSAWLYYAFMPENSIAENALQIRLLRTIRWGMESIESFKEKLPYGEMGFVCIIMILTFLVSFWRFGSGSSPINIQGGNQGGPRLPQLPESVFSDRGVTVEDDPPIPGTISDGKGNYISDGTGNAGLLTEERRERITGPSSRVSPSRSPALLLAPTQKDDLEDDFVLDGEHLEDENIYIGETNVPSKIDKIINLIKKDDGLCMRDVYSNKKREKKGLRSIKNKLLKNFEMEGHILYAYQLDDEGNIVALALFEMITDEKQHSTNPVFSVVKQNTPSVFNNLEGKIAVLRLLCRRSMRTTKNPVEKKTNQQLIQNFFAAVEDAFTTEEYEYNVHIILTSITAGRQGIKDLWNLPDEKSKPTGVFGRLGFKMSYKAPVDGGVATRYLYKNLIYENTDQRDGKQLPAPEEVPENDMSAVDRKPLSDYTTWDDIIADFGN